MAFESKWMPVTQLFTADGTTQGLITVSDATGYYTKQSVTLISNTQPSLVVQVQKVLGPTLIVVGRPNTDIFSSVVDVSGFRVSDSAKIFAPFQNKFKIKPDDIINAVYERDPAVAFRVVNVDKFGTGIDAVTDINGLRRLAVDAAVTISGVTVNLDAFTKVPPDNAIAVGTEDGTRTGTPHALQVAANGLLQVQSQGQTIPEYYSEIDLAYDVNNNLQQVTYHVPSKPDVILTLSYDGNGNLTKVLPS